MTADQQQPIACTLSGEARQDRRAWIDALARDALRGIERDDLTLRLRFAPEAIPRIQDMRPAQRLMSFLHSSRARPGPPCGKAIAPAPQRHRSRAARGRRDHSRAE